MSKLIETYNELEGKSIQLVIEELPHVAYFCTSASIPGISATAARQYSPFTDVKHTGDKLVYQPLIVNFILDEKMNNWKEIFNWMVRYAHPGDFKEYKGEGALPVNQLYRSKLSGAKILLPNNKYNPSHEFTFEDVFPIDLSDIVIDTQISSTPVLVCTATFEYTKYEKTA